MTRQPRIYFQNAVYHISIRGNNKLSILQADKDKISFLESLSKFKLRFKFKLYAFVVMDNHAHLIVESSHKTNISKIIQALTLSYSVKFRKKYPYTGYVWQGRFKSNIIDNEDYILKCIEYIHNNPVRVGIVNDPQDYSWSSYRFYSDLVNHANQYVQVDKFNS